MSKPRRVLSTRPTKKRQQSRGLRLEELEKRLPLTVVISEFLAENDRGLEDAAGHNHDWIELTNTGGSAANIAGWFLTDDALDPTKWEIPATAETTSLAPGERLLVYASGDNGEVGVVGSELHTNFQLSQEPGYLGLVRSDGSTIEHSFNQYPQQTPDVSYGSGVDIATLTTTPETLVGDASPVAAFVPNGPDQARDDHWREQGYDDTGWLTGSGSVGWDMNGDSPNLNPFIGRALTTSGGGAEVDINSNSTVYVRYKFDVADKEQLTSLVLNLRFDDGFIAYLNGREFARANFAEDFVYAQPQWNSYAGHQQGTSSSSGNWNRTSDADDVVTFDITPYLEFLEDEGNVLAFHGVNSRSSGGGGTHREDFLIDAQLVAERASGPTQVGFMASPSPGNANGVAYYGFIADTNFSVDRGVYDTAQTVAIVATEPGTTIRYTTDYSEPTLTNGSTYTAPLSVSTTTVLRVKAFKTNFIPTNVDTQTYIFPNDVIQQDASYVTQPYETWGHDKEDEDNTSGYNLDDESDWEMDPDIVTGNETALINALKDLPTISIVTDWDNLWSGTPLPGTGSDSGRVAYEPQGIYIHGRSSERPNSFEYFTSDGSIDAQVESVIEIQGHSSPGRWNSDKLSFQVKFKAPYGDPSLDLDLFADTAAGEHATDRFDTLILDAMYNYAWHHPNVNVQSDYARFVTDQVTADLQNLASGGEAAPHGRWTHLYLDGLYWGVYYVHERPDENFASEYYGGSDEDYYVVKHSTNDIDGLKYSWAEGGLAAEAAFNDLLVATRQDMTSDANYEAVEAMLDIDQYIDYMIVHMYAGNENDWPHNNWYATFDAASPDGKWRFHAWDQEHAFPTNDNGDSFTQFVNLTDDNDPETPGELIVNLMENDEFRLRFSDRVHELMQNGGVLTPDAARAVYQARVDEITQAILGESARWGDNRDADDPYTQADFLNIANGVLNTFFPTRTSTVLGQFDSGSNDWLVDDLAPTWNQYGGVIPAGFNLTMSNPNGSGTIYYTLDGTDPRDRDTNAPSASAIAYTGAVTLTDSTRVRARVFANSSGEANDWSAEVNKAFSLDEPLSLRIVEVMYNPVGADLEYIELLNTGTQPIDLAGVQITDFSAEGYTFDAHVLGAGERIVVSENLAAFQSQYPSVTNVASTSYTGSLSNGGETVTLIDAFGNTLQSFAYDDDSLAGWPTSPDGDGPSLEYIGPLDAGENPLDGSPADPYDNPVNWRASAIAGGTPGIDGSLPGDYDNNGTVEEADWLLWVSQYGQSVTPGTGADGNGDGVIDAADYTVWRDNEGASLAPSFSLVVTSDPAPEEAAATNQVAAEPQTATAPQQRARSLALARAQADARTPRIAIREAFSGSGVEERSDVSESSRREAFLLFRDRHHTHALDRVADPESEAIERESADESFAELASLHNRPWSRVGRVLR